MFDRYIVVDWSASSTPKSGRDSIWICVLDAGGEPVTSNPTTRSIAERGLRRILVEAVDDRKRTLVGFDFPYGYPAGLAAALRLAGPPWRAIWAYLVERIRDGSDNKNNRFAVAAGINRGLGLHVFWGCPMARASADLSPLRDQVRYAVEPAAGGLAEWRRVELLLRRRGRFPHSAWKLLGAGSVGSQALTGIPVVARLRSDEQLDELSRVWPFELAVPDLAKGRPAIVYAEVWPSLLDLRHVNGRCRDEIQVVSLAEELSALDRTGQLRALFAAGRAAPAAEEGWILGVLP